MATNEPKAGPSAGHQQSGGGNAGAAAGEFVRRVLTAVGIVTLVAVLAFLMWFAGRIFLLAFAGVLLAIFLHMLSDSVSKWTRIPYRWSLTLVIVLLVVLTGLGAWKLQDQLSDQVENLAKVLPSAMQEVRQFLEDRRWGRWILDELSQTGGEAIAPGDALSQITGVASSVINVVVGLIVILFVGLYGAAEPKQYMTGLLLLVPPAKRERAEQVIASVHFTLRWWIVGQLAAMILVGLLTGIGLWLIGIELALVLGILAGVLELIPYFGPILAFTAAVMVALVEGPTVVIWVIVLYFIVQFIEAYVFLPLIYERTVWLPPAVTVVVVVLMGLLGGILGVFVAAPLTAMVMVLVKTLYIQDVLGDHSVTLASDQEK